MSPSTARSIEVLVTSEDEPPVSSPPDPNHATTVRIHNYEIPSDTAVEAFLLKKVGADNMSSQDSSCEALVSPLFIPSPGDVIGSRYRLDAPLASGGMGSVWAARHVELDVPVAVKLMATKLGESSRQRARFVREAKAAAKLRSRNVVAVLDYGVDQGTP